MENSDKILGYIKNIEYYAGEIRKAISEQFDMDFSKVWPEGILEQKMITQRVIWGNAADIDAHCKMIEVSVKQADKPKVAVVPEKKEEETGELFP